jgi:carboxylesterase type B
MVTGEELRQEDPESHSTGNYGLQDQRMAFDWVRRNIGSCPILSDLSFA